MTSTPAPAEPIEGPFDWRDSPWPANVWLLFLSFPLLSLFLSDESTFMKVLVTVLVMVFAAVHVLGYRANALRARGAPDDLGNLPLLSQLNPWPYFFGLIAIQVVCVMLAGIGLLGLMPFIVVFAVFNFSWSIAAVVGALCLIAVLVVPAMAGQLDDVWFFPLLIVSGGAGASFARMGEETLVDRAALQTNLAVSDERNRVARDVHDVLGHSLTAVILKTQVCAKLVDSVQAGTERDRAVLDKVKAELAELDTVSRRAMAEVRSTVGGLRVATLVDEVAAARAVLADAAVELTVRGSVEAVPDEHEAVLAWVVRESVTNIVRHAEADTCTMEILGSENDDGTLIRITDDGVGLGASGNGFSGGGNGMRGMRERVAAAGAELVVGTGPQGRGTRIEVRT